MRVKTPTGEKKKGAGTNRTDVTGHSGSDNGSLMERERKKSDPLILGLPFSLSLSSWSH